MRIIQDLQGHEINAREVMQSFQAPFPKTSMDAPGRLDYSSGILGPELQAVAQYQRLRQGSPLQLAPQELMQAAAHTPRTRFAFTPDHRAGHAPQSPAPGFLMQSVAGGPRFPTLAVRRGSTRWGVYTVLRRQGPAQDLLTM